MDGSKIPDVIVANLHRRYTGVSSTVMALLPIQRNTLKIGLVDTGHLELSDKIPFWKVFLSGWTKPSSGKYRIWHARRDVEILTGLILKKILRQPWKIVFTSAAPHRHNIILRSIINQCDAVIATSPKAASFLNWHTKIIYHGVDTDYFRPHKNKPSLLRNANLPATFVIGQFGRIRYSKGTDLFINALIRLLPKYPDFCAVITGLCQKKDLSLLKNLQKLIKEAGLANRIIFLGDIDRDSVLKWYQTVHLCVAASRSEGFGLTPLEAFSCGVPVVASTAGAWPEIIKPEAGAIFEAGSLESLIEKLEIFMANPSLLQKMGQHARDYALKHFSIEEEAQSINEFYLKLMK